jgi:hypothetical protein
MILLSPGGAAVRGQETTRTEEQIAEFDQRGDATIKVNSQLGASQWAQWKDKYGDHQDILFRDLQQYQLPTAVIEDFRVDKDDIHRRVGWGFKARALANYSGNAHFEIRMPKSMTSVTGSRSDWSFSEISTETTPDGGYGIVNTTHHIKLPAEALDVHLVTGNDYNQLVYSLKVSRWRPKLLLYLGLLLLVAAAVLGVLSFRPSRAKAASPP